MALFENLLSEVERKFGLGAQVQPRIGEVLQLVMGGSGGSAGCLDRSRTAGAGGDIFSWRGGAAMFVQSGESVLGTSTVSWIARRLGLETAAVGTALGFVIPKTIGLLTTCGKLPAAIPAEVTNFLRPMGQYMPSAVDAAGPRAAAPAARVLEPAAPVTVLPAQLVLSHDNGVIQYAGSAHDEQTHTSNVNSLNAVYGAGKVQGDIGINPNRGKALWRANVRAWRARLKVPGVQAVFDDNAINKGGTIGDSGRNQIATSLRTGFVSGLAYGGILRAGCAGALMLLAFPLLAQAQTPAPGRAAGYVPDFAQIATYVFVMLGPVKMLGPFARMTRGMDSASCRRLALIAILISLVTLMTAATMGVSTLAKWRISQGALQLAGGVIIFLVALKPVLAQFAAQPVMTAGPVEVEEKPAPPPLRQVLRGLVFPTIVTPQGLALIILVVAAYPALEGSMALAVVAIMVLNLMIMLLARLILKAPGLIFALMIFGNVMGVLQVALGIQLVIGALRVLGVMAPLG